MANATEAPKAAAVAQHDCSRWKVEGKFTWCRDFAAGEEIPDGWHESKFDAGVPRDPAKKKEFMEKHPLTKWTG